MDGFNNPIMETEWLHWHSVLDAA